MFIMTIKQALLGLTSVAALLSVGCAFATAVPYAVTNKGVINVTCTPASSAMCKSIAPSGTNYGTTIYHTVQKILTVTSPSPETTFNVPVSLIKQPSTQQCFFLLTQTAEPLSFCSNPANPYLLIKINATATTPGITPVISSDVTDIVNNVGFGPANSGYAVIKDTGIQLKAN
jgi:hypothetical protein